MNTDYVDVVIVGAGLSGIGAARHLQDKCPDKRFAILEAREAMGGTWDLFRYPGIRSDSDMYTLGYSFKPWTEGKAIADGPAILNYIHETAAETGIEEHIRYRHKVQRASWSSDDALWTVECENTATGETVSLRCNFLYLCAGYYKYDQGYLPEFAGYDDFGGTLVHPQHWPEDLDYEDKEILIIGSGATAVTLVPELAKKAKHVTMLQRSPTYMAPLPDTDWVARLLQKLLPAKTAYAIVRWKNILFQRFVYWQSRKSPKLLRWRILRMEKKELDKGVIDFDKHLVPRYNPWDQRICLVPNGDLFESINAGKASIVTDTIDTFTEDGIRLASGEELKADIIVTATGLDLCVLGDIELSVDGRPVNIPETFSYKAMMFSDVPNLVSTFGYINASWTLKSDLTAEYTCRVLNHMDETGMRQCTPRLGELEGVMPGQDWISGFSSGYIQRKAHLMPKQGDRLPWLNTQNYLLDKKVILEGAIEDGYLVFSNPGVVQRKAG